MNKASIKESKGNICRCECWWGNNEFSRALSKTGPDAAGNKPPAGQSVAFQCDCWKKWQIRLLLAKRMHLAWKWSTEENWVFLLFGKSSQQFVMWCEYDFNGITEVLGINQLDWCKYTFWVEKYICTLLWMWSTFSLWVTWWSNHSGDTERCPNVPEWRGKGALTTSLMHVWNIHLVIDVGLREGRGQASYRGSVLICWFYLNCILVELFNLFSTSSNFCGCCDGKRSFYSCRWGYSKKKEANADI